MKKNGTAYMYFYIHFIVEVVCFFFLSRVANNSNYILLIPFIYDLLAFVPQSIIGYIADKNSKINMGMIGIVLLIISYLLYGLTKINLFVILIVLGLGNAFLHIAGAENTLKIAEGRISPAAIFVGGGAFGVIIGKLLSLTTVHPLTLLLLICSLIPFVQLADSYVDKKCNCKKFDYVKKGLNTYLVIIMTILIVALKGYIGYGIPNSWGKTDLLNIIFFVFLGIGIILGGILSDKYGIRKVAILSTLLAIPFLCFGNNIMILAIIGVLLFSMTMAINIAIIVSVLKDKPCLALGITAIGFFLGTIPLYYVKLNQQLFIILVIVISILCSLILGWLLKDNR